MFLERYYEKNLTNEEMDQAVYLVFVAAKEKAKSWEPGWFLAVTTRMM